jgi:gluconokinase
MKMRTSVQELSQNPVLTEHASFALVGPENKLVQGSDPRGLIMSHTLSPRVVLVMGVTSSGKSTVGEKLASDLNWTFRDADSFHPAENVAKMSSGQPLNDEDRKPWLAAIARFIDDSIRDNTPAIVTCSALKRVYRDVIIGPREHVRLVHLVGDKALIGERMAARRNHFMPTSLLDSQFATLEPPQSDEHPLNVSIDAEPSDIVDTIITQLSLKPHS